RRGTRGDGRNPPFPADVARPAGSEVLRSRRDHGPHPTPELPGCSTSDPECQHGTYLVGDAGTTDRFGPHRTLEEWVVLCRTYPTAAPHAVDGRAVRLHPHFSTEDRGDERARRPRSRAEAHPQEGHRPQTAALFRRRGHPRDDDLRAHRQGRG